jgi:hypothetical protein
MVDDGSSPCQEPHAAQQLRTVVRHAVVARAGPEESLEDYSELPPGDTARVETLSHKGRHER